jgi:DNA-binding NtrC family response regulator
MIDTRATGALAIADPCLADRQRLAAELRAAADVSVFAASSLHEFPRIEPEHLWGLVLAPGAEEVMTMLTRAGELYGSPRTVIIGYLPAVAAFAAARMGAEAFLPKPVTGQQVLAILRSRENRSCAGPLPTLARAEWEYLHAVLDQCGGNRSEAARRLGIHRSVLQRKLGRHPPTR